MRWSPEVEDLETTWLRMMSEYKYDSYQDFRSGSRFVEALLDWLQQFKPEHRPLAYSLLREHLIFLSTAEIQHLINRAFPAYIRPLQVARAAKRLGVPQYLIWSTEEGKRAVEDVNKRTLFVGLSDGARMDVFRRANVGIISNEQVVVSYDPSDEKWADLEKELKKRANDQNAQFELIVLLDDFAGSGTTLLRRDEDKSEWKGKLPKISQTIDEHSTVIADHCDVIIHHYVGTERARLEIEKKIELVRSSPDGPLRRLFGGSFIVDFGIVLPNSIIFREGQSEEMDAFVTEYYDPAIMTSSLELGGKHVKFGFAHCGLPLVMEHNTPNNSLALLWAESPPQTKSHLMRPLFRRRQRHF